MIAFPVTAIRLPLFYLSGVIIKLRYSLKGMYHRDFLPDTHTNNFFLNIFFVLIVDFYYSVFCSLFWGQPFCLCCCSAQLTTFRDTLYSSHVDIGTCSLTMAHWLLWENDVDMLCDLSRAGEHEVSVYCEAQLSMSTLWDFSIICKYKLTWKIRETSPKMYENVFNIKTWLKQ